MTPKIFRKQLRSIVISYIPKTLAKLETLSIMIHYGTMESVQQLGDFMHLLQT